MPLPWPIWNWQHSVTEWQCWEEMCSSSTWWNVTKAMLKLSQSSIMRGQESAPAHHWILALKFCLRLQWARGTLPDSLKWKLLVWIRRYAIFPSLCGRHTAMDVLYTLSVKLGLPRKSRGRKIVWCNVPRFCCYPQGAEAACVGQGWSHQGSTSTKWSKHMQTLI